MPQAKLLKEQLEVVKYRDADSGALRYSIRPVEGQLTFDKVQLHMCVCALRQRQMLERCADPVYFISHPFTAP